MTEGLDLSTLTIKELKDYIKEHGLNINVHSKMKKDELLELVFDELRIEEKEESIKDEIAEEEVEEDTTEEDSHANEEESNEEKKNIPTESPKRDNTLTYAYTLEEKDIRTDRCRELVIKDNKVIEEILIAEDVPQIVKMKMKRAMYERRNR